jgi:phosphate uptake regulator
MSFTRKLQKIGESLFVSLPKAWVKRMELSRGDTVTLVEHPNGSLSFLSEVRETTLKQIALSVEADESMRSLRRRVTGAYVDGFDLIRLEAAGKFTDEQQDAIRGITEDLFGLEIVELSSNLVTIQCLLTKTLPIEKMVKRIHGTIKSMFGETISALKEGNPDAATGVAKRTSDVKRLSLVVHRLLRSLILYPTERMPEMKPIDSVDFLRVNDKIAEIAGGVRKIAESIMMWKQPYSNSVREKLIEICGGVLTLYDSSMQALMSKDIALANRVLDEKLESEFNELWNLLLEAEKKAGISAPVFSYIHLIIDNLERISIYSLEIAEIAIDRAEEVYEKE